MYVHVIYNVQALAHNINRILLYIIYVHLVVGMHVYIHTRTFRIMLKSNIRNYIIDDDDKK